ncbi:MAG: hypothetical protein WC997_01395 [Porticoccaceae bacterium]
MDIIEKELFTWDVPLADETLLDPLPNIPHMSENFCFTGHDPERRLGYYVHIGRWIKDPEILRELLILWLPDGSILWAQSFGRGDCTRGPSVACQRLVCEEPGKRVRILYNGPMQHIPLTEVARPNPEPTELDKVEVDLLFEGSSAMWYYPQVEDAMWSKWHTEQWGRVKGSITHVDRNYDFSGVGYRDHSRGPRYLPDYRGHSWIQGQFPEGDSFAIYKLWQMENGEERETLSAAKIHKDGKLIPARVIQAPRLTESLDVMGEFELVIESELGRMSMIAQPRGLAFFSFGDLMSHFLPSIPTGDTKFHFTNAEQPSIFTSGGRTAVGHVERNYYRGRAEMPFNPERLRQAYGR